MQAALSKLLLVNAESLTIATIVACCGHSMCQDDLADQAGGDDPPDASCVVTAAMSPDTSW